MPPSFAILDARARSRPDSTSSLPVGNGMDDRLLIGQMNLCTIKGFSTWRRLSPYNLSWHSNAPLLIAKAL